MSAGSQVIATLNIIKEQIKPQKKLLTGNKSKMRNRLTKLLLKSKLLKKKSHIIDVAKSKNKKSLESEILVLDFFFKSRNVFIKTIKLYAMQFYQLKSGHKAI